MAVLAHKRYTIRGGEGLAGVRGYLALATLASGTIDITSGLKTVFHVGITSQHASAAVSEYFSYIKAVPTKGFNREADGIQTIKSSSGASTATIMVDVKGYGA